MNLSEKIYHCRKKVGKSQEALAESLGVSRQAVSKWETGDAEPEISKLRLLANEFGVTVDWLLSEEEPVQDTSPRQKAQEASAAPEPSNWVGSIPGVLGKLIRKFGWLFGIYLAVSGAGFTLIGGLARGISKSMFSSFSSMQQFPHSGIGGYFPGVSVFYDEYGNLVTSGASNFAANNPVAIVGTVIIFLGILMMIAGVILAVVLRKQSKNQ